MIRFLLVVLALTSCSVSDPPSMQRPPTPARVDHVIIAVADLEQGIAELERLTGVRPIIGGIHPGRGTRNALMSLGDGVYLELLAPDPAQAVDNEELRELRGLRRPTPVGWAVSSDDEQRLRSMLTAAGWALSPSRPGSRRKPDGSQLRWVIFGYESLDHPLAPFFIVWTDPALHPSRTSPAGCRLADLRIEDLQPDQLRRTIAPLRLRVRVEMGERRRMELALACPTGNVSFG